MLLSAYCVQVIYYTYWTYSITSGYVVLAVYSFFLASIFIERFVLSLLHCVAPPTTLSACHQSCVHQTGPCNAVWFLYYTYHLQYPQAPCQYCPLPFELKLHILK